VKVPRTLGCPDCDGTAHLLAVDAPDQPLEEGAVVSYRCASCWERFDVIWEDQGDEDTNGRPSVAVRRRDERFAPGQPE
jgi:hypothetical protein